MICICLSTLELGSVSVLLDLFHRVLIPHHFLLQFAQISFCSLSRIKWMPHNNPHHQQGKRLAPKMMLGFGTKRAEYKSLWRVSSQSRISSPSDVGKLICRPALSRTSFAYAVNGFLMTLTIWHLPSSYLTLSLWGVMIAVIICGALENRLQIMRKSQ